MIFLEPRMSFVNLFLFARTVVQQNFKKILWLLAGSRKYKSSHSMKEESEQDLLYHTPHNLISRSIASLWLKPYSSQHSCSAEHVSKPRHSLKIKTSQKREDIPWQTGSKSTVRVWVGQRTAGLGPDEQWYFCAYTTAEIWEAPSCAGLGSQSQKSSHEMRAPGFSSQLQHLPPTRLCAWQFSVGLQRLVYGLWTT